MGKEYAVFAKKVFTEKGVKENCVIEVKDGIIQAIKSGDTGDYCAEYLTYGLIDNHTHGGNGFDILTADEKKMENWLLELSKAGVCAVMSCPYGNFETIRNVLKTTKNIMKKQKSGILGGARLLGVHIEGPFLSKENPGAMVMEDILEPDIDTLKQLILGYEDIIVEMTIAPENPGADKVIEYLKEKGIKVLAGHTVCDYDTAIKAFNKGVGAICHTFNCTPPVHHRNAGILNAALTEDNIYCEMIGDLKHLHPSVLKLIMRAKNGTHAMLISDAVMTANCPDGSYVIEGIEIEVKDSLAKIKGTQTLFGANCYISKSVKNLTEIGISFEAALMAAGRNVARWLGLDGYEIEVGNKAFFTAWDKNIEPVFTAIFDTVYR